MVSDRQAEASARLVDDQGEGSTGRRIATALLISRGAHPEAIKRHLGHSSITVTMDTYGHLFPSETEALAQALDALYVGSRTDKRRTGQFGRIRISVVAVS